jgi:hypothetical protein
VSLKSYVLEMHRNKSAQTHYTSVTCKGALLGTNEVPYTVEMSLIMRK